MLEHTQLARHLRLFTFTLWLIVNVAGTIGNEKNPRVGPRGACSPKRLDTNKNSFSFRRLGNGSRLDDCIDFCCRDVTCELAMFSRFHCFGVSCHKPALCHQILDHLLMEDEKQLKRNPRNAGTKDFIRHTSQVAKPSCPQRFVPSFHLFLLESGPHLFRLLDGQPKSTNQCSADCCESRDCLLSFIEGSKCYGVVGREAQESGTNSNYRKGLGLQVAVIDRNKELSRSLIDDDDDTDVVPDELGSDESDRKFSTTKRVPSQPKVRQEVYRPNPFDEHSSGQNPASYGVAKAKKGEARNVPLRSTKVRTTEHSNGQFSSYKVKTTSRTTVSTISKWGTYKPKFQRPTKPSYSIRSTSVSATKSARRNLTTLSKPETLETHTTSSPIEMKNAKTDRTLLPSRNVGTVATQSDAIVKTTHKPRFSHIRDKRVSKPAANVHSFDNLKTSSSSKTFGTYTTLLPVKIKDASKSPAPTVETERKRLPSKTVLTVTTQSDAVAKSTHKPRFPQVHSERIFNPTAKVRSSVHLTTLPTSKTFGTYSTLLPVEIQFASKTPSPNVETERTRPPSKTVKTMAAQTDAFAKPTHKPKFPQVYNEGIFKSTTKVHSSGNLTTFSTFKTFGTNTTFLPVKKQDASKTLSPTFKTERTRLPSKTKPEARQSDAIAESTHKLRFPQTHNERIFKPTSKVRSSVSLTTFSPSKTFGTNTTLLSMEIQDASKTLSPTVQTERTHLPSKTVKTVTTQSDAFAKSTHKPRFLQVHNERIFKTTPKAHSSINLTTLSTSKTFEKNASLLQTEKQDVSNTLSRTIKPERTSLPSKRVQTEVTQSHATKTLSPTIKTERTHLPSKTVKTVATQSDATKALSPTIKTERTHLPSKTVKTVATQSDVTETLSPIITTERTHLPSKRVQTEATQSDATKTLSPTIKTERTHLPSNRVQTEATQSDATKTLSPTIKMEITHLPSKTVKTVATQSDVTKTLSPTITTERTHLPSKTVKTVATQSDATETLSPTITTERMHLPSKRVQTEATQSYATKALSPTIKTEITHLPSKTVKTVATQSDVTETLSPIITTERTHLPSKRVQTEATQSDATKTLSPTIRTERTHLPSNRVQTEATQSDATKTLSPTIKMEITHLPSKTVKTVATQSDVTKTLSPTITTERTHLPSKTVKTVATQSDATKTLSPIIKTERTHLPSKTVKTVATQSDATKALSPNVKTERTHLPSKTVKTVATQSDATETLSPTIKTERTHLPSKTVKTVATQSDATKALSPTITTEITHLPSKTVKTVATQSDATETLSPTITTERTHLPSKRVQTEATQSDATKTLSPTIKTERTHLPSKTVKTVATQSDATETLSPTITTERTHLPSKRVQTEATQSDATKTLSPTIKTERTHLPSSTVNFASTTITRASEKSWFSQRHDKRTFKPTTKSDSSDVLTTFLPSGTFETFTKPLSVKGEDGSKAVKDSKKRHPSRIQNASKTLSSTAETDRRHFPRKTVKTATTQSGATTKPIPKSGFSEGHDNTIVETKAKIGTRTAKLDGVQNRNGLEEKNDLRMLLKTLFNNTHYTKDVRKETKAVKVSKHGNKWTIPHGGAENKEETLHGTREYDANLNDPVSLVKSERFYQQKTEETAREARGKKQETKKVDLIKDLKDLGSGEEDSSSFNGTKDGKLDRILPLLDEERSTTKIQKKSTTVQGGHKVPKRMKIQEKNQKLNEAKRVTKVSHDELRRTFNVVKKNESLSKTILTTNHSFVDQTFSDNKRRGRFYQTSFAKEGQIHKSSGTGNFNRTFTVGDIRETTSKNVRKGPGNRKRNEILRGRAASGEVHRRPISRSVTFSSLHGLPHFRNNVGQHHKVKGLDKQRNRAHLTHNGKLRDGVEKDFKQLNHKYKPVIKNSNGKLNTTDGGISIVAQLTASPFKDKNITLPLPLDSTVFIANDHKTKRGKKKNGSAPKNMRFQSIKSSGLRRQTEKLKAKYTKSVKHRKIDKVLGTVSTKSRKNLLQTGSFRRNPSVFGEDENGSRTKTKLKLHLQLEKDRTNEKKKVEDNDMDLMQYASSLENSGEELVIDQPSGIRHSERYVPTAKTLTLKKTTSNHKSTEKASNPSKRASNERNTQNQASRQPYTPFQQLPPHYRDHYTKIQSGLTEGNPQILEQFTNSTELKLKRLHALRGNRSISLNTASTVTEHSGETDAFAHDKVPLSLQPTTPNQNQMKSLSLKASSSHEKVVNPLSLNSSSKVHLKGNNEDELEKPVLPMENHSARRFSNTTAEILAHFFADGGSDDGIHFSVGSGGKHHKGKKSSKSSSQQDDSLDVEDLGDADFDIMMSNDIPRKKKPQKQGKKTEHHNQTDKKKKDRGSKKRKTKKRVMSEENVLDQDDDEKKDHAKTKSNESENPEETDKKKSSDIINTHKSRYRHKKPKESSTSETEDQIVEDKHKKHKIHKGKEEREKQGKDNESNSAWKHSRKAHHRKHVEDEDKGENGVETSQKLRDNGQESNPIKKRKKHTKRYHDNKWQGERVPGKVKEHKNQEGENENKLLRSGESQGDDENDEIHKKHQSDEPQEKKQKARTHGKNHEGKKEAKKRRHHGHLEAGSGDDSDDHFSERHQHTGNEKHEGLQEDQVEGENDDEKSEHRNHRKGNHNITGKKTDDRYRKGRHKSHKHHEIENREHSEKGKVLNHDKEMYKKHKHHRGEKNENIEEGTKGKNDKGSHKHNRQENHERTQKRTGVPYETVKKRRHSLHRHEGFLETEDGPYDKENDEEDGSNGSEPDDSEEDENDYDENSGHKNQNNDEEDESKKEEGDSGDDDQAEGKRKGSRSFLGEDSDDDTENEEISIHHRRHRKMHVDRTFEEESGVESHRSEHRRERYHEDDNKRAFHHHHHSYGHRSKWGSVPKQRDSDNYGYGEEENEQRNGKRHSRKSFIYRERNEGYQKPERHHGRTRHRQEQKGRQEESDNKKNDEENREYAEYDRDKHHHEHHKENEDIYLHHDYSSNGNPKEASGRYHEARRTKARKHKDEDLSRDYESQRKHYYEEEDEGDAVKRRNYEHNFRDHEEKHGQQREGEVSHLDVPYKFADNGNVHGRKIANTWHPKHHHFREKGHRYEEQFRQNEEDPNTDHLREREEHARPSDWEGYNERGYRRNRHNFHRDREHDVEESAGSFQDSSSWMFDEAAEGERFYGGESSHGRRGKKHRKHRQSYEYWRYGQQYPNYYNYGYSKQPYGYDSPWASFQRIPKWQKQPYPGYRGWKPSPSSHWNPSRDYKWGKTSPWGSELGWSMTQTGKPGEPVWQKVYDDGRGGNVPTPRSGTLSTSWGPTRSRWQPGELRSKDFREGWSLRQNQSGEKHYKDWSGYQSPTATSNWPKENIAPGTQPWKSTDNGNGPTPQGRVQSNYFTTGAQQNRSGIGNQARFLPTAHRQYLSTVAPQTSKPDNISKIHNIMDKLNLPLPAPIGNQAKGVPTVNQVKLPSKANNNVGPSKTNGSRDGGVANGDRQQNIKRLHGFFNEEVAAGQKKSGIKGPDMNNSGSSQNISSSVNGSKHNQLPAPKSTRTPIQLPQPQPTAATNKTTLVHTKPPNTTDSHTSRPANMSQNVSTTAMPVQQTTADHPTGTQPFGDVSQPDESSEERGKKHRKHRAPVCMAGKITDDLTLLRGKRAGNFTNIGDVGDFEMCIKRCCQHKNCDVAFKSAETCFLVHCFSKESCQTSPTLDDIFSPRMCVVKRHLRDEEEQPDEDGGWNDKVSPSGIHEVCDAERALGILWKKTAAGRSSKHPCPREAKGFVQRKCEADSRWLPPDFSECVSADYQNLYEKSKRLAVGADPSPLIRELSQLTTQNIDNSLIFGGDLDRATDIMAAIVQHNGQTDLLDMTREDVENFVRASSNLLDMTNQQEWSYIQMEKPGSADVLRLLEMFALQAAIRLPREDMTEPTITNNIIIKMDRKSAGDEGLTFPDFSNPKVNRWDARHDVIALPASVFDRGEVSTASISFKSLPYLLPDSNVSTGLGPNSKVISTVLHPHPQEKITPPVTVVLSHIKRRRGNPKCVFWDYTLNPHKGGAWSSRGCWLAYSNQSHSICQCSHLSNFAVLMDLSSDEVSQKEQKKERTMALMWIGIPVLIVGVIGALYMSFSWNRKSGITGAVQRPSAALNEKTGLLGQRVVTSQVREEFPSSPSRDLYRALSPGYSPTSGDLEWQDEFELSDVESASDHGFKKMLLPRLQLLQKQLINEFYEGDKTETKRQLLESKIQPQLQVTPKTRAQTRSFQKLLELKRRPPSRKLRVRFADERLPRRNLTDDDKQRFKRLQKMERRCSALQEDNE